MTLITHAKYYSDVPFSFLKIDNTVWNECAMSRTRTTTLSGAIQVFPMCITIILCPMVMTSGFLHLHYQYKF
jgi:hypothetical protein